MSTLMEQRICVKFCLTNEICCSDTYKMLKKTYGESCMSKTRTYEWYKSFKEGRTVAEDLPRSGRPSTSTNDENVEKAKKMVLQNCRVSEKEIAADLSISTGSARTILTDVLGMRRVSTRFVPKMLTFIQKEQRKAIAEDMIFQSSEDTTFIQRIITGDKMWVYEYDIDTNEQSTDWLFESGPINKKPRQSRTKVRTMLIVFFDCHGIVHSEFLPQDQAFDQIYYLSVLQRLRENVRLKRPDLWEDNLWILHHDIWKSYIVRNYLANHSVNMIEQAPYSPDLTPSDFFLFPKLKLLLRGKRFETVDAVKENALKELNAIPKLAFEYCFKQWIKRYHLCVSQEGDYFEDKINTLG